MQSSELDFLNILKLTPEEPTLAFLKLLLKRHQRFIPYENVSKLLRRSINDFTIPSFEDYIEAIQAYGYGGTCFAQNLYFFKILRYLGYDTTLQGHWENGQIKHPNMIVRLGEKNYFVDLGIMSSFVGPYLLDSRSVLTKEIGNQTYVLTTAEDQKSSHLEIFRNGKLIREHKNSGPAATLQQMRVGIADTFENSQMFMTNLVAHKVFGDVSKGIWNKSFYLSHGKMHEVTEMRSYEDLKNAFSQLEMPKAQLNEALEVLQSHGIHFF